MLLGPLLEGRASLLRLSHRTCCGAGPSSPAFLQRHGAGVHGSPRHQRLGCAAQRTLAAASAEQLSPATPASQPPHVSVLLHEVLGFFEGLRVETYVDGTLGAGGHASEMLRHHPELRMLVGFDLDVTSHTIATARLEQQVAQVALVTPQLGPGGRLTIPVEHAQPAPPAAPASAPSAYIVHSNFGSMKPALSQLWGGSLMGAADAVLLDLGMSSMQVDESERGFSFMRDGPLDMRMDTSSGAYRSAEELVNTASEMELGRILRDYGEERYWKGIARRIVCAREEEPITTTQQLVRVIGNTGGGGKGKRGEKQKHPATRTFQALRIAVNDELRSIAQVLPDAIDCLRPGGRLAVITFHSLEDRITKWAFRQAAGMAPSDEDLPSYCVPFDQPLQQPLVKILTRRPVVPSEAEQQANSRSRSAKLRVVERL